MTRPDLPQATPAIERQGGTGRVGAVQSALAILASGYIAILMIAGGGGTPAPLSELVCQIAAVAAALAWLWLAPAEVPGRAVQGAALLLVAVPAAQLVPLPPALWQGLPGRALLADALALVGAQGGWHPLSIAPARTLQALLSLGPPLLALGLASRLDQSGQRLLLKTIAATGLLSVLVGTLQMAASGGAAVLFYTIEPGVLHGFQANRNAQADVLLIALLALVAVWAGRRRGGEGDTWVGAAALVLLFAIGVFLTTSRTGIVLLPVALGCAALMVRTRLRQLRLPRWSGLGAAAAASLAALWAWRSPVLGDALARFDFAGEYRSDIWQDTLFAIGRSWPVGSGFGTFTHEIFPAERLEAVGITLPNRAHNEVLELALEGGLAGLICWGLAALLVLAALARGLRRAHGGARLPVQFAAGTLMVTGLHSLVDYPFRSVALAALIATAAGFALSAGTSLKAAQSDTEAG